MIGVARSGVIARMVHLEGTGSGTVSGSLCHQKLYVVPPTAFGTVALKGSRPSKYVPDVGEHELVSTLSVTARGRRNFATNELQTGVEGQEAESAGPVKVWKNFFSPVRALASASEKDGRGESRVSPLFFAEPL
jgi:hypothetical protein